MDDFDVQVDDSCREWSIMSEEYTMSSQSCPLDPDTEKIVKERVAARVAARALRKFDVADLILEALLAEYRVHIDDRLREWTAVAPVSLGQKNDVEEPGDGDILGSEVADLEVSQDCPDASAEIADDIEASGDSHGNSEGTGDNDADGAALEEEPDVGVDQEEALGSLTVVQLKDRLRDAGLPVSGRKSELIERLIHSPV